MKEFTRIAAVLLLLLISFSMPVKADSTKQEVIKLQGEVASLKEGQEALQKDLAEIKKLLQEGARAPAGAAAPFQPKDVKIDDAPFLGDAKATVTLMEFSDYQCPFCSRHMRDTFPQIENDYIKTGKVRYVLREFPLESIHPQAIKAAEAAGCASDQGKYWEMHDRLFANQNALAPAQLTSHAEALSLDAAKFKTCLDTGKFTAKVRKDLSDAQKYGATGTPTFFIGLTDPKSSDVKAVRKIVGAQTYAAFKDAIDTLLAN